MNDHMTDMEEKAVDKVIRTKWDDGTQRGWKCPWCPVEWTSITFTVNHMIGAHPEELDE